MPVTVSVKVPGVDPVHETVAVPAPVTLFGVIAPHVRLAGGLSVRATTPVKPLTAAIVIVEEAEVPTGTDAGDDVEIVKSTSPVKVKLAVAV